MRTIVTCFLVLLVMGTASRQGLKRVDADHVKAWSKGGATDIANCQMLCKTHNREKGNR